MTQTELIRTMPFQEFKYWVAYISLQDEDYEGKIKQEVQKGMTEEELGEALQKQLLGLMNNGTDS